MGFLRPSSMLSVTVGVGLALVAPMLAQDTLIVAAGDIACASDFDPSVPAECQQMATAQIILNLNPDWVLPLGDNQYETGVYADFLSYYDSSWGFFSGISFPVVGNHEYRSNANATGYFDYFNGVGIFSGPAGDRDAGYYSWDVGTWHLIALNGNCDRVGGCQSGSPQEIWLQSDLAANGNPCVLAYWHQPRFNGVTGDDFAYLDFWGDLYTYGADLVINGHAHQYERYAPQDPDGNLDLSAGIRQFVVGTGGRSLEAFRTIMPNSEVRNAATFGVLELTLHPGSYDWQFLPIAGQSFTDSGSGTCHACSSGCPSVDNRASRAEAAASVPGGASATPVGRLRTPSLK